MDYIYSTKVVADKWSGILDKAKKEIIESIQEIVRANDAENGDGEGGIVPDEYLEPDDETTVIYKSSEARIFCTYRTSVDVCYGGEDIYNYDLGELHADTLLQILEVLNKVQDVIKEQEKEKHRKELLNDGYFEFEGYLLKPYAYFPPCELRDIDMGCYLVEYGKGSYEKLYEIMDDKKVDVFALDMLNGKSYLVVPTDDGLIQFNHMRHGKELILIDK